MPENTQRTTTKAGWHYANRPSVPLPTQSYMQSRCLLQPADCLVEMRRIELLSESIVSSISPSAATDYF